MAATNIFESNDHLHGERATETAHRRVELQSPQDLTYLIANVQKTARAKIDRDLPPDAAPEGEDAMRKRVEQLVDDYIRNTFDAAKNSMSINGMDSKELDAQLEKAQEGEGMRNSRLQETQIESFDSKLAQRIQALSSQIENHTLHLANQRRTAPAETSQRFQDSFMQDSERYDARLRKNEQQKVGEAKNTKIDVGEMERLNEVQSTWQNGSDDLLSLKSGLGSTVAKMERAHQANDVLHER